MQNSKANALMREKLDLEIDQEADLDRRVDPPEGTEIVIIDDLIGNNKRKESIMKGK